MSPGGYSEFQGTGLIEGFFGFRDIFFLRRGWRAIRKIWREFFVGLDLSKDILGGENNLKACDRSKTKLDLCLFKKLARHKTGFT